MFNTNFDITGIHANYLKDLCELRGNVADKEQHNNFKIFKAYIDAYILCPLIGYQYGRKGKMGNISDGDAGILAEQIIKHSGELKFVYQVLMLVDEDSEPDVERRIYRAFKFTESADDDKGLIAEGMRIYNEYFLGGVEVLHEQFVRKGTDRDQYIAQMYQFTKNFYDEQDGEALKAAIDEIINK